MGYVSRGQDQVFRASLLAPVFINCCVGNGCKTEVPQFRQNDATSSTPCPQRAQNIKIFLIRGSSQGITVFGEGGWPRSSPKQTRVPHLRDSLIVAKVGIRATRTVYRTPACSFRRGTFTPITSSHSINNPSARTPRT